MSLRHMCYRAEFGRSRSNGVRISRESQIILERCGPALGMGVWLTL